MKLLGLCVCVCAYVWHFATSVFLHVLVSVQTHDCVWVYVWVKFERQRGTGGELRSKGHKRGQKKETCAFCPEGFKSFWSGRMCGRRDKTGEGTQVGRDRRRERGGFKCQVTWNTLVWFGFVSRAWSFKNNSL